MREFSVPASFTIGERANTADILHSLGERTPDKVVFHVKTAACWAPVRAGEVVTRVIALAKGLVALGVEPGDRVALLCRTRLEWTLLDFAIWTAGGTTVPIYDSSSASQIDWILEDSGATILILETDDHRAAFEATGTTRDLTVLQIDTPDEGDGAIGRLTAEGADVTDETIATRRAAIGPADPATLIYTSGTTGRPKGCMLTHANLLAEVRAALSTGLRRQFGPGKRILMFLPMAHVLARAINLIAIEAGVEVGYTHDTRNLVPEFAVFAPSMILSVPRVFEKVFNASRQSAQDSGRVAIFDRAADTAIAYSEALDTGGPGLFLKARHAVFDRLVYARLRTALGGQCELAVSGGGPLGARLGHFFRGVGIPVYEGYGLTETTAAFSVNTPGEHKVGSVGKPLPGNGVRIADDSEVLLQGGVVFTGYWNNPEATASAIEGGWFHTGDLGSLDEEGYLTITGRKKELIVTAGGKNVSPSGLEDVIRASPLVSQALVVGDAKPFVGALVTIDEEAFTGWKERNGKPESATVADLADDPALRGEIQAAVDDANKTVSHAEGIKKFRILPADFTEETGEITPTMKVKRNVVVDKYAGDIAAIYG